MKAQKNKHKNIINIFDCLSCWFLKPISVNSTQVYTNGLYHCLLAKELGKEYRFEILTSYLTFLWDKCPCKEGVLLQTSKELCK